MFWNRSAKKQTWNFTLEQVVDKKHWESDLGAPPDDPVVKSIMIGVFAAVNAVLMRLEDKHGEPLDEFRSLHDELLDARDSISSLKQSRLPTMRKPFR